MSHTAIALEAPSGSQAAEANDAFQTAFPANASAIPLVVVVQRQGGLSVTGEDTRAFTYRVFNASAGYQSGAFVNTNNFQSYYTLLDAGLEVVADELLKEDITLIIMNVDVPGGDSMTDDGKAFVNFVDDTVHNLAQEIFNSSMQVWLTGSLVFGRDVEIGTEHDLLIMDGAAFPVALAILALVLRSLRLLIMPVLCIVVSILTAFTLVYPIALSTMTVSFTPSLMMSATIAMSIDYSLFLLSRYREELLALRPVETAIIQMLRTSGHTVLVSGTTLALCFAGLAFFQVSMLSIPGLATAIAITIAVIVNLSLTPALLLAFPTFFANSVRPMRWPWQSPPSYADSTTPLLHLQGGLQQVNSDCVFQNEEERGKERIVNGHGDRSTHHKTGSELVLFAHVKAPVSTSLPLSSQPSPTL